MPRHPAQGQPKHRLLSKPEITAKLQSLRPEEAQDRHGGVEGTLEGGLLAGEGVVFVLGFVVLAAQFGPFGEFVLGGGGGHFAVEAHDVPAEGGEVGGFFGLRGGEEGEESPYLE